MIHHVVKVYVAMVAIVFNTDTREHIGSDSDKEDTGKQDNK